MGLMSTCACTHADRNQARKERDLQKNQQMKGEKYGKRKAK
jgi:hypothetical protein